MRLLLIIILSQFFSLFVAAQKTFKVKGSIIESVVPVKVFLLYKNGQAPDSTILKDGNFSFEGKFSKPFKTTIYTQEINSTEKYPKREYLDLYVEEGLLAITAFKSLKNAVVKGGSLQKEYNELQDSLLWIKQSYDHLSALIRTNEIDDTTRKRLRASYKPFYSLFDAVENRFITNHPSSIVSWDIVANRGIIIDPDKLEPVFNLLSEELKQQPAALDLKQRIETAKKLRIGNPAIEFFSNTPDGVPVSLSSFKGKYVLIDFWASWCAPCRAENPNMVKAYNSLKDKNFEIFGVSLDDKKDSWLKAVEEDKLPWVQVSDLKGFNTVAKTYGIRAIPQNLLLDPQGKIIGINLRGETLTEEVKKRMGL
ncbi:MAG: redoxin domain-containing protein [Sediminibacterium sp.]